MPDTGDQLLLDFASYADQALSTEASVDHLVSDSLQGLIDIALATAALLDLYKKSLYCQLPVPDDQVQVRLRQIRSSLDNFSNPVHQGRPDLNHRLFLAALGLFTEAGEILEKLATAPQDHIGICEELGDLNWYQAVMLDELETPLAAILAMNLAKLRTRYPARFSSNDMSSRDLSAERSALASTSLRTRKSV